MGMIMKHLYLQKKKTFKKANDFQEITDNNIEINNRKECFYESRCI